MGRKRVGDIIGKPRPRREATYLQDEITNRWGTAELPRQGRSGTFSNKDGDAGSFIPPACPGYRHHFGLGKPPPPTVPPMRHAGALEYTGRKALRQLPVRQGGREEAQTTGGGGSEGEFWEGLPGLWGNAGDSHLVQITGTGYDGGGRRLDGSGRKIKKGSEELEADDKDPGPGEGRPEDIRFGF